MKDLLRRLKLLDSMITTLPITQQEFESRLREVTDEGDTGVFFDTFDVFSSSKNEFKGIVTSKGFKIKKRRRFFDMNTHAAVASGTFEEKDGMLTIETEIDSFHNLFLVFLVFGVLFYCFIISLIVSSHNGVELLVILFIIFHALLMFGIPYFMMRRSVMRLKYDLEREFFFLTKAK